MSERRSAKRAKKAAPAPVTIAPAVEEESDDVVIADRASVYPAAAAYAVEDSTKVERIEEAKMDEIKVEETKVDEVKASEAPPANEPASTSANEPANTAPSTDAAAWAGFWAKVLDVKAKGVDVEEVKARTGEVIDALRGLGVKWADVGVGYMRIAFDGGARALERASQQLGELQAKLKHEPASTPADTN